MDRRCPAPLKKLVASGVGSPLKCQAGVLGSDPASHVTTEEEHSPLHLTGEAQTHGESAVAMCLGCWSSKRNVCRVHGDLEMVPSLDDLTGKLTKFAEHYEKEELASCTIIVHAGRSPSEESGGGAARAILVCLDRQRAILA